MGKSLTLVAAATSICLGLACASSASAGELQFSYVGSDGGTFFYDQSSNPNVFLSYNNLNTGASYTDVSVSNFSANPVFLNSPVDGNNGSIGIGAGNSDAEYLGAGLGGGVGSFLLGPQLYTGSVTAPFFAPGVFTLYDIYDNSIIGTLTVTDSTSAVPEPTTWAMMVLGFCIVAYSLRIRSSLSNKAITPAFA